MYSLIDALARGDSVMSKSATGSTGIGSSDAFSKIFNSTMQGVRGGIDDMLSRVQERFPHAKVREGEVPAGIEESKKAAGEDGDTTSDKVTMSQSLLESMLGNSGLAKMVENAIGSFLEGANSGGAMNMEGAYVQRSVTITITTVRYTEMQRSQESDEILAASELQTSLQEKIEEMLQRLFGGDGADAEKSQDKTASTLPSSWGNNLGSGSVNMWSMELFYSMTSIQAQSGQNGSGASASFGSFQFSASYSSFSGLTSQQLPSLLSQFMNGGTGNGSGTGENSGSGSLSEFLEETLSNFGLSGSGYRQTGEGFFFKVSQSRNLIAELMELYGDRIGGSKGASQSYESDPSSEVDAGVAEEQPAEAVAAAG